MPLVRVSLRRGKPAAYRAAILDGVYRAMRATFDVPDKDRFMVTSEHDEPDFAYSPSYLGIARSDDLVLIQITANKHALDRAEKSAVPRHRRQPRGRAWPAPGGCLRQSRRGAAGELVVRQRPRPIRQELTVRGVLS